MTFTFDPAADYYELFEMCLSDGTTEVLNDPEDFDEFVQALKDGRYDPESGIAPLPLTKEQEQKLLDEITQVCGGNNSWFNAHHSVAFALLLTGEWPDLATLEEFHQFVPDATQFDLHKISYYQ